MSSPQSQNASQFFRKPVAPPPKQSVPTLREESRRREPHSDTYAVGVFTPAPQALQASVAPEVITGRPAGFWIRADAFLIDGIFLGLTVTLVEFVVGGIPKIFSDGMLGILYFSLCHGLWGQTLGKKIFKIRVVTVEGLPISMKTAWLRAFATIISQLTLGIGYLMAGWRSDKRALHDLAVKTCVVRL